MTAEKKRILFVDDEAHVLEGLRNLFRRYRHEWDMTFATSGPAALEAMHTGAFHVVVSDMRMPGMDGAALLQQIKDEYPSVARIVLSGQADRESIMRALPVAHQFLSKPCNAELLRSVIERTCGLQALLDSESLRRVVGGLDHLPSVPAVYRELSAAASKPEVALASLAEIVERDPAMAAKVLQLVNSAYFGLAQRLSSIHHAVLYLGVELLRGLTLTASVFSAYNGASCRGFSLEELQSHSTQSARIARRLLKGRPSADEGFTAGLVHDVGQVVLATGFPKDYADVLRLARDARRPLEDCEEEIFGVNHGVVGAYLLGVWGLPFSIVEAVAYHHRPHVVATGGLEVLAAVHLADNLADASQPTHRHETVIDFEFVGRSGLSGDQAVWIEAVAEELGDAAAGQALATLAALRRDPPANGHDRQSSVSIEASK